MDASTVIGILAGLLVGAVAALRLIAPRTATTADDKVLERMEQLLGLVPDTLKRLAVEVKADAADAAKAKGA